MMLKAALSMGMAKFRPWFSAISSGMIYLDISASSRGSSIAARLKDSLSFPCGEVIISCIRSCSDSSSSGGLSSMALCWRARSRMRASLLMASSFLMLRCSVSAASYFRARVQASHLLAARPSIPAASSWRCLSFGDGLPLLSCDRFRPMEPRKDLTELPLSGVPGSEEPPSLLSVERPRSRWRVPRKFQRELLDSDSAGSAACPASPASASTPPCLGLPEPLVSVASSRAAPPLSAASPPLRANPVASAAAGPVSDCVASMSAAPAGAGAGCTASSLNMVTRRSMWLISSSRGLSQRVDCVPIL
mmetsp:Transcript_26958/g.77702  ORF Transcript_26958/g.77702 Transcript_26958/m.77702 type:complete len:305 (-) Transcript_26958:514-1428(-)